MKKLSRNEMKKVMGGNPPTATYKCCLKSGDCGSCSPDPTCASNATMYTCSSN